MKTISNKFLLIILFTLSIPAFSQTLTAVDCNPAIKDHFQICMPSTMTPGSSGLNATWDFSTLFCSLRSYPDTIIATVPSVNMVFPSANMVRCVGGINGTHQPLNVNSNTIEKLGAYNMYDSVRYSDPEVLSFYPMSYGATYSDTYSKRDANPSSNYTLLTTGIKSFTVDGSGSLVTPEANFPYALRVYIHAVESTTSVPSNLHGISILDTYVWYAAGAKDAVAQIVVHQPGSSSEYREFFYLHNHDNLVGIKENENDLNLIYPNPAKDFVNMQSERLRKISIFNNLGQLIKMENVKPGETSYRLSITDLEEGIYILNLTDDKGFVYQKKLVVEK